MSRPLLVVVDTNVLVSGLLSPTGVPAQVVDALARGLFLPLFDLRTLAEAQDVLTRPRLKLHPDQVEHLLRVIPSVGRFVMVTESLTFRLPDPKDVPFLEVALSGGADALVTGNARDFHGAPSELVVSPRDFMTRLLGVH